MSWFLFYSIAVIHIQLTCSVGDIYYKAGIVESSVLRIKTGYDLYLHIQKIIEDASKRDVDILVLPFTSLNPISDADGHQTSDLVPLTPSSDSAPCDSNQYSEEISYISCAAKDARMYVIANLSDKDYCEDNLETFNTIFVFNRNGEIIKRYREQYAGNTNCMVIERNRTFETDFGVTFGMLSDYNLVNSKNYESILKPNVKNYILFANSALYPKIAMINFPSAWAYVHKVNLLVSDISGETPGYAGLYSNREMRAADPRNPLLTMNIRKETDAQNPISIPSSLWIPGTILEYSEDLNSYTVQPLDSAITEEGHRAFVCQTGVCCEFFLKTRGHRNERLALVVSNGARKTSTNTMGLQACRVIHCDDLVDNRCTVRLPKRNNLVFEIMRISGNFSEHSQQYPAIVMDVSSLDSDQFVLNSVRDEARRHTSLKLTEASNVAEFGILSKDFSGDVDGVGNVKINMSQNNIDMLDKSHLDSNSILYFLDSVWITLRIPIFIVSIYVLEQI